MFQGTLTTLMYVHLSFLSETEFLIVFSISDRQFCIAIWEGWNSLYRKLQPLN